MGTLTVDTDEVRARATGVRDIADRLTGVRVDQLIDTLGTQEIRGGAVAATAASTAAEWLQLLSTIAADVAQAAHDYDESAALYDAIEHRLAAGAAAVGRRFMQLVAGPS